MGTASIQDSSDRNPSINNILAHSKQYAVEMISKFDRLNIKKREATLIDVSKSYKFNKTSRSKSHRNHNKHTLNTWRKLILYLVVYLFYYILRFNIPKIIRRSLIYTSPNRKYYRKTLRVFCMIKKWNSLIIQILWLAFIIYTPFWGNNFLIFNKV